MNDDLQHWRGRPQPERKLLEGRFVRLEPLDAARHGDGLYAVSSVADADTRFAWLYEYPPESRQAFEPWLKKAQASEDPLYFAVIDRQSGDVVGRQTLMRIDAANGVAETGSIYWGPKLSRTPGATEALYLHARYILGDLGYRRFEWKCHNRNAPSKRAAERFGFTFEGIFRQHLVVKGKNRDTAWYSMLDREWPVVGKALEAWLDASNFDDEGLQKRRLEEVREQVEKDRPDGPGPRS